MTVGSPTVMVVQNDVAPGQEAAFDAWYLADHMPDRVGAPGFRRARRWRAFEGGPRDLSFYELDGPEAVRTPAYLAKLAAPTAGTKHHMPHFVGMVRTICAVQAAEGFADGGCAALVAIMASAEAAALEQVFAAESWRADPETGVVARAVLRCDPDASRNDSAEARMRLGRDRIVQAALWIEAATPEQLRLATRAAQIALDAAGIAAEPPALVRLIASFHRPPASPNRL
jgi:hypothetical protein